MSTVGVGREAEDAVAAHLSGVGHEIVEQNWRSRWCEIDVISRYKGCVYFTEVKYRSSSRHGSGYDYVTSKKLKQMRFAAEFWLHNSGWTGECQLQAAAVTPTGVEGIVPLY